MSLIRAPEYLLRSEYQDSECFPKQIQTYYSTSFSQTLSAVCKPFVVPLPLSLRPVLRLTAASESCPTETLDPDDENLSYYQYDFSQQYRALWSIDFPRAEEDVQGEPESESETDELSTDDTDPTHNEETLVQYIDPPSQTGKDTPLIAPSDPENLKGDSEAEDTDQTELRHRGSERIEEKRQTPSQRPVSPQVVKEEVVCKQQEGMTTLQAVTLVFYLLAFLVILQRFWVYIGRYILT